LHLVGYSILIHTAMQGSMNTKSFKIPKKVTGNDMTHLPAISTGA